VVVRRRETVKIDRSSFRIPSSITEQMMSFFCFIDPTLKIGVGDPKIGLVYVSASNMPENINIYSRIPFPWDLMKKF